MNPIVINGTVLCDNITGIPRYVYENVIRLDKLIEGTGLDVRIAYRDDGRPIHLPELKNIRLVPLKSIPYFTICPCCPPTCAAPMRFMWSCQRYAADPPQRRGAARHPPAGHGYRQGLFPLQVLGTLPVHQMVRPAGVHGQATTSGTSSARSSASRWTRSASPTTAGST